MLALDHSQGRTLAVATVVEVARQVTLHTPSEKELQLEGTTAHAFIYQLNRIFCFKQVTVALKEDTRPGGGRWVDGQFVI